MSKNIKVLIVEDDDGINNLLSDMLIDNGYNVECAYSGTEALIYLKQEGINIVLLDLMLPGKSGEEVLKEISSEYKIPVIIISAKEEQGIKPRLLRAGANDFINKPFDIDEVLARIEVNIRRHSMDLDKRVNKSYKEIEIFMESRLVKVNEEIINLTTTEFDILELMINHPNKVFSKNNLFKSVWREDFMCDDNTITVHISNLRNK
ncbi:MAG: response regulator transcription factor, partial [Sarcina sp.]